MNWMPTHARGGEGREETDVLGACSRDTLNDNGECLLTFTVSHGLALVNTCFSTPMSCTSRTFNDPGLEQRIEANQSRLINPFSR